MVEGLATANPREAEAAQLAELLSIWDSRIGGMLLGRGPRRFSTLSQEEREAVLIRLSDSPKPQQRALFGALKGAATTAYYLNPGPTGSSPLWEAMGYPGPLGTLATAPPRGLSVETPTGETVADCDVVVVGSGAGGATAAAVLAAAGLSVIVVEKGHYFDDADFDGGELSGLSRLYAPGPSATGRRPAPPRSRS